MEIRTYPLDTFIRATTLKAVVRWASIELEGREGGRNQKGRGVAATPHFYSGPFGATTSVESSFSVGPQIPGRNMRTIMGFRIINLLYRVYYLNATRSIRQQDTRAAGSRVFLCFPECVMPSSFFQMLANERANGEPTRSAISFYASNLRGSTRNFHSYFSLRFHTR